MFPKVSFPVPERLYLVVCDHFCRTTHSLSNANEIADTWRRLFHYTVKIYVYERNNENESCWHEKV